MDRWGIAVPEKAPLSHMPQVCHRAILALPREGDHGLSQSSDPARRSPPLWEYRLFLLLLMVVIAAVGSHMPARYRHDFFVHRRVVEAGQRSCHGPDESRSARRRGRAIAFGS